MYHVGRTETDRAEADKTFYQNMTLVIDNETRFGFMKRLRLRAAMAFFEAVQTHGSAFFNAGKSLIRIFEIGQVHDTKKV